MDDWFLEGAPEDHRKAIKLNRLVEMHEAAVSAIIDTDDATPHQAEKLEQCAINSWGMLMRGAEKMQFD